MDFNIDQNFLDNAGMEAVWFNLFGLSQITDR